MIKYIIGFISLIFVVACGKPDAPKSNAQSMAGAAKKSIPVIDATVQEVYNIKPTGKTNFGYEYVLHTDTGSEQIKPGEYAYFSYYVKMRDSIVGSSIGSELGKIRIDSTEAATGKQPSPVMDALRLLGKGDSITVYWPTSQVPQVPPQYKDEPFVVYDIVLKDIKNEEDYRVDVEAAEQKRRDEIVAIREEGVKIGNETIGLATQYREGKLKNKLTTTESGLKYMIHKEGTGDKPNKGNTVLVHYYGILPNGSTFDNSFERGQPINFPLGQGSVIKGWDEALALFKEGTTATIFVPYELAYGEAGRPPKIPERSELIFYVELEKVFR